jgi:hypothetical protein
MFFRDSIGIYPNLRRRRLQKYDQNEDYDYSIFDSAVWRLRSRAYDCYMRNLVGPESDIRSGWVGADSWFIGFLLVWLVISPDWFGLDCRVLYKYFRNCFIFSRAPRMRVDSVLGIVRKRMDLEFNVCKDRLSFELVSTRRWHIPCLWFVVHQAYVCCLHERATPLMAAWYENPNLIAALSGFLIAAVPAGFTARYAWKGKIAEVQTAHSEKTLVNLLAAHDNFIKELRAELADKSKQIGELQSSRTQLYRDIDEIHGLRLSERRASQQQMFDIENKLDETLDKLHASERQAKDCEIRCNELQLRVESLETSVRNRGQGT